MHPGIGIETENVNPATGLIACGSIVPIIELRIKFNFDRADNNNFAVVVDEQMLILMDIEKLMASLEMGLVEAITLQ